MFNQKSHKKLKVGLFGGSFNPPHKGHVHVSNQAVKLLGLDEIWWLVSPQNPLKPSEMTDNYEQRFELCQELTSDIPFITISGIEDDLGTKYSADTVDRLKAIYGNIDFVWIIGADNLIQLPKWQRWKDIFNVIPIAVFNREPYSEEALGGIAAKTFAKSRIAEKRSQELVKQTAPAWCFLNIKPENISSTEIRERDRADNE